MVCKINLNEGRKLKNIVVRAVFIISCFLVVVKASNFSEGVETYNEGNKKQALELLFKACKNEDVMNCIETGHMFYSGKKSFTGRILPQNYDLAGEFYKTACDKKVLNACHYEAIVYLKQNKNDDALPLLIKTCNDGKGYSESCYALGEIFLRKDSQKALKYYTNACDNNHYKSCFILSVLYDKDKLGIKRNQHKSFQYSKKACTEGDMNEACILQAYSFVTAEGTKRDVYQAELMFRNLCNRQYKQACKMITLLNQKNIKITPEYKQSKKEYYQSQQLRNVTIDTKNHLMWQDDKESITLRLPFDKAKEYCHDLVVQGFEDWRLPIVKEAFILLDNKNKTYTKSLIKNSRIGRYWVKPIRKDKYMYMNFNSNYRSTGSTTEGRNFVRCVRNN